LVQRGKQEVKEETEVNWVALEAYFHPPLTGRMRLEFIKRQRRPYRWKDEGGGGGKRMHMKPRTEKRKINEFVSLQNGKEGIKKKILGGVGVTTVGKNSCGENGRSVGTDRRGSPYLSTKRKVKHSTPIP